MLDLKGECNMLEELLSKNEGKTLEFKENTQSITKNYSNNYRFR